MAMPLGHFRQDIVEPNIEEFRNDAGSIQKGFNAVSAVDSFAAHILTERMSAGGDPFDELGAGRMGGRNDNHFRGVLAGLNDTFGFVRDVAKANKHAFLTQGNPRVNGSGDTTFVEVKYGDGGYGMGLYDGGPQLIVHTLDNDQHRLIDLVEEALKFLDETAASLGMPVVQQSN